MFYIEYGNSAVTLKWEQKENTMKDAGLARDLALDIFHEDLIDGVGVITFAKVIDEDTNETVYAIEQTETGHTTQVNRKYFKGR